MKNNFTLISLIILSLFFNACSKKSNPVDPNSSGEKESVSFLAYYKPGNEKVLGETPLIALLKFENNQLSYTSFLNAYPPQGMTENADINGNVLSMGLHADFNDDGGQGLYLDLSGDNAHYLPLVPPTGNNDYSYFQPTTSDVSENGQFVIYSSATNDRSYGDEYQPFLIRYNVVTGDSSVAVSPKAFALSQPEKGTDTETGMIERNIFASPDGKYAYGDIVAFGLEGNSYHYDYYILFRYDFEAREYKRLGETDDNNANIIAMGSERTWILYSNNGQQKLLNLATNTVTYPNINAINVKKNSWGINGACVGSSSGNLYYKDFVNNNEVTVCQTNTYGWAYNAMFSNDGGKIYFTLDGNNTKYLCVTDGITENSKYDTLGTYPEEFYDIIMVK